MNLNIDGILNKFGFSFDNSIGMSLSGGGAKGFAHIGVLMAFEKFGLKPDIMSGVSSGSIAGVLYAAGLTPLNMIECFTEAGKFGDFTQWSIPKEGLLKLDRFAKLLDSWLPVKKLEELKIPMVVCATNFDKGTSVGWLKGEIVPRVVASCSIPVIFRPVKINGVNYVDGGVLRNLPAWAIRKHCRTLFGSHCSPLRRDYKYRNSITDIALRTYNLMLKANALQDINLCDYLIQMTDLNDTKTFELNNINSVVTRGYDAACRLLENIY